ncbi:ribonuclease D [Alteromonas facilis]|uniref:ribonuclease D n=1 Tax=Alteromonas facilis TaxID=2048004 RepID=UPI001F0C0D07|nr:ribonuclease D [Alteromonas facilis]
MPIAESSGYRLITDQASLNSLCDTLGQCDAIAIDTEFVRTRTLLPQLGLIQINDGQSTWLIDPLDIDDLKPLADVLSNADVVKVLHACSEDLEVFLSHLGVAPAPIFDTQFAANLLDMGPTLGYSKLVEIECEVEIDKGESRTDWLARPLSSKQLEYAANDVIYLYQIYSQLSQRIQAKGWTTLVYQELASLAEKKAAQFPDEYAYLLIGNVWKLNQTQRFVLKRLASWRLKLARERDIAINFIVKEQHMLNVAMRLPRSKTQLNAMNTLLPQEIRKHGDALIDIVNSSLSLVDQNPSVCEVPKIIRLTDKPGYKQTLAKLKTLCQEIAQQQGLGEHLIASKKQLNQLLKWWWFELDETALQGLLPDLLSGWRKSLFQAPLIELLGQPIREIT